MSSNITEAFFRTNGAEDLAALHVEYKKKLNDCPETDVPLLFAYAARCLFHNPKLWIRTNGVEKPTQELLTGIDALLDNRRSINCRDNYYYEIVGGLRRYVTEDYQKSFISFARAASRADFYRVVRDDFGGGASFIKTFPNDTDLVGVPSLVQSDPTEYYRSVRHDTLTCSIHVDYLYSLAFSMKWIHWWKLYRPSSNLHLHIVFRGQAAEDHLSTLLHAANQADVPLTVTYEYSVKHERAYFACSRFLRAHQIMRNFDTNVLFLDADIIFKEQGFEHVFQGLNTVAGSLSGRAWNGYLPWRFFSATYLFVPNNDIGLSFAARLKNVLCYFWDARKERNWWIDQLALEVTRIVQGVNVIRRDDTFWKFFEGSEQYKIKSVGEVPALRLIMDQGIGYWEAIRIFNEQAK